MKYAPLNGEPCNSGFFGKHIPTNPLNYWLRRRILIQFLGVILIIHIVTHTDKFSAVIATCEQNHGDPQDLRSRDSLQIWRIGFKNEFIDPNGDWPNK
jgi:hypothetical protein